MVKEHMLGVMSPWCYMRNAPKNLGAGNSEVLLFLTRCTISANRTDMNQPEKWVRVMCDFAATGLWSKSGSLADLDSIPLDPHTYFRLGVWQSWYEHRRHDEPIMSLDKFVEYGLDIAKDIKAQLPDWIVIYHDESKEYTDPMWEYEVTEGVPYNPWKTAKRRG